MQTRGCRMPPRKASAANRFGSRQAPNRVRLLGLDRLQLDFEYLRQKRVHVRRLVDGFADRLAAAVAGFGFGAEEDRAAAALGLQGGGELSRVQRDDAVVAFGRRD